MNRRSFLFSLIAVPVAAASALRPVSVQKFLNLSVGYKLEFFQDGVWKHLPGVQAVSFQLMDEDFRPVSKVKTAFAEIGKDGLKNMDPISFEPIDFDPRGVG